MKKLFYIALIATTLHQNIKTGIEQLYSYAYAAIPAFNLQKIAVVDDKLAVNMEGSEMKVFTVSEDGTVVVGYSKGDRVEDAKLSDVVALLSDDDDDIYSSQASFSTTANQSYELASGGRIADIERSGTLLDPIVSYTSYSKVLGNEQG